MKPETLLRLYPRKWRERYGDEFVALLSATGATPAQVMDIVRAAVVERVRNTANWAPSQSMMSPREASLLIAGTVAVPTLLAGVANLLAFVLHGQYGYLPPFNSTIAAGNPAIVYPPTILPTLFWYARLQSFLFLRLVASGGPLACWLRVSRAELALWLAVICVSATARQLQMFATFGEPGFPSYSRAEIFWSVWPDCLSACIWLWMSTRSYWDAVLAARERRMQAQGEFPGITRLGLQ